MSFRHIKRGFLAAGMVMSAMLWVCGAGGRRSGQQSTKSQAMAKDADPDWEVATVRASDPNDTAGQHFRPSGTA